MRAPLSHWRYWLAAALLLLAGAMGGAAAARQPAENAGNVCHHGDRTGCAAILTAPAQPTILQALSRLDGKALAQADGHAAGLIPDGWGLLTISGTARRAQMPESQAHRRRMAGGSRPRAPPALT
ncbi:hypothetical protein GE253_22075 [Niveispirillum sp. SYP-B3756]|uniref:hypothetical protein n=1 Tax=Niveispirillum sp. SYP-B3756 TaxID=2662178 RepID=UPI0012928B0C|nr:hypothetical protein [Niveispirillum sp. SYP-B3756]MQP68008.1 hypothetical protein [Niveispirillum sp. SYP-B3756]